MRNKTDLDTIKKYTIRALMSDEKLMYALVLKRGNALQLAYNITDRASIDIDFSIEGDFEKEEIPILERIISGVLIKEFEQIVYEEARKKDLEEYQKNEEARAKAKNTTWSEEDHEYLPF